MADKTQIELFKRIYKERLDAGTWRSDISNKPLYHEGHPQFIWQFSHNCARSAFPMYKLNPENIDCLLPSEHQWWEHRTEASKKKAIYKLYEKEWLKLFAKHERLKTQYFEERLKQ